MHSLGRWILPLALVLVGWLVAVGPAAAQKGAVRPVDDNANLFGAEAERQANAIIADIKKTHKKELYVETFSEPPAKYANHKKNDKWEKGAWLDDWAAELFKQRAVDGVYVLICYDPAVVKIRVGDTTRSKGFFTASNTEELDRVLLKHLKASANARDEKQKMQAERDKALVEGASYVRSAMDRNHPVRASGGAGAVDNSAGEFNILGWICIGLVVVFVIWIVFAVIRALTAPRYGPGYGGGGGYGGGYGGGGGGGFFPGLLGGLFGAAAGMWMYNSMFGGGGYQAHAGPPAGGYDQGGSGAGSDVGGGSTGTGGDWSADDAGGDKGGDKGDFGGGGKDTGGDWSGGGGGFDDAGGGGDGGGGGGDWGGGGGDFGGGGGGGGDFGGGGGGDFGGGGGGGDW